MPDSGPLEAAGVDSVAVVSGSGKDGISPEGRARMLKNKELAAQKRADRIRRDTQMALKRQRYAWRVCQLRRPFTPPRMASVKREVKEETVEVKEEPRRSTEAPMDVKEEPKDNTDDDSMFYATPRTDGTVNKLSRSKRRRRSTYDEYF